MTIVYEDGAVIAHLHEERASPGHIIVEPRTEARYLSELPEDVIVQLFYCASFAATAVFEGLGAQGTNIFVVEGHGQVQVHVLSRMPDDGIDLLWEPKRADPAALQKVAGEVKEELWYVGRKPEPESKRTVAEESQDVPPEHVEERPAGEKNYKVEQLFRTP